ncbi:MAG: MFS transporter, partial [Halobacteria archaeon]|nr:MFS transporter [Halobacteria archaeon]
PFIVGGFALLVPSMVAQGYILEATLPWWTMLLARLVQGTALALVFAPSLALAGDLAKKGRSGSTLSVLTMGFGLGIAVGPLASGFLARYGISVPFFAGAGLAAVALALVYSEVEDTVSGTEAQET